MGLTLAVGFLSQAAREEDEADLAEIKKPYEALNEILMSYGLPEHNEPLDIPENDLFEAKMWGYVGLHYVRRMAAHLACEGRLPSPGTHQDAPTDDPMIGRLIQMLLEAYKTRHGKRRLFPFSFKSKAPSTPPYEHLLCHSDADGFYVPQNFEHVLFDSEESRPGIGGMVGSSVRLLEECLTLAEAISLPPDMDHENEEFWTNVENPPSSGEPWQIYGLESFGLIRLIHGCRRSIQHQAVLLFT